MNWEFQDQHLKEMRDSLLADRADGIADAERRAEEAAAQGSERGRRIWQESADEMRAYRFHWEREQDAAA